MSEFVQVLGSDDPFASGAALLWAEDARVVFNCPEGLQRFAGEVRMRLTRLSTFFFTRVDPGSVMGLPGVLFTINDAGVQRMRLAGPGSKLELLWNTVRGEFFHYRPMQLEVVGCERQREFAVGNTMTVTAVPCFDSGNHVVYSYVCSTRATATFDAAKAKALGVKPGSKYAKLKAGTPVQSDANPDVTVQPSDVLVQPTGAPRGAVLIADCSDPSTFPDVGRIARECNVAFHTVVHMAPYDELSSPAYVAAVEAAFAGAAAAPRHVIATGDYRCRLTAFPTPLANRYHLKMMLGGQMVRCSDDPEGPDAHQHPLAPGAAKAPAWPYSVRHGVRDGAVVDDAPVTFPTATTAAAMLSDDFRATWLNADGSAKSGVASPATPQPPTTPDGQPIDVGVRFYGTGSAVPSKYRNVTSLAVRLRRDLTATPAAVNPLPLPQGPRDPHTWVLCDCGEGSMGQMWNDCIGSQGTRRYAADGAPDALARFLASVDFVFISHMHADHHLGIFGFILARLRLALDTGLTNQPLVVSGPAEFVPWARAMASTVFNRSQLHRGALFESYAAWVDRPMPPPAGVPAPYGLAPTVLSSWGWTLTVFTVDHPASAHGITIRTPTGTVMFSGDTQPCPALLEHGAGAHVVIHEATFSNELAGEARQKRHSTVGEAIDAARGVGAHAVLLTHFSQRFPKLPVLDAAATGVAGTTGPALRVGISFDLLDVPSVQAVDALHAATPALQALLAEYEAWGDGTTKRLRSAAAAGDDDGAAAA